MQIGKKLDRVEDEMFGPQMNGLVEPRVEEKAKDRNYLGEKIFGEKYLGKNIQ